MAGSHAPGAARETSDVAEHICQGDEPQRLNAANVDVGAAYEPSFGAKSGAEVDFYPRKARAGSTSHVSRMERSGTRLQRPSPATGEFLLCLYRSEGRLDQFVAAIAVTIYGAC